MYPMFKKDMSLLMIAIGSISLDLSEKAALQGQKEKENAFLELDKALSERAEALLVEYLTTEMAREAQTATEKAPH